MIQGSVKTHFFQARLANILYRIQSPFKSEIHNVQTQHQHPAHLQSPGSPPYHPYNHGRKDYRYQRHILERIPAAPSRRPIYLKSIHTANKILDVTNI